MSDFNQFTKKTAIYMRKNIQGEEMGESHTKIKKIISLSKTYLECKNNRALHNFNV